MKRYVLPAGAAIAAIAPAAAEAKPPTPAHARAYEHAYHQVGHQLGARVPGRNIVEDGVAPHRAASDAEVVSSLSVLDRMLAPGAGASTSSTPTGSASTSAGSTGGLPACASESG